MKFLFIITSILCAFTATLTATTFITVSSGMWSNNNIWQNAIAPPLASADTIVIRNFIEFDNTLNFSLPAHVIIDSNGALCGHDTIFFNTGTKMDVYGTLECDVFLVPGGNIYFYSGSNIIWSQFAQLTNGAFMHSSGSINTGPWFNCISKGTGIDENESNHFSAIYAPATGLLTISGCGVADNFITDMQGRLVARSTKNIIECGYLLPGIYIITSKCEMGITRKRILVQ
jgi:hypothetical protein